MHPRPHQPQSQQSRQPACLREELSRHEVPLARLELKDGQQRELEGHAVLLEEVVGDGDAFLALMPLKPEWAIEMKDEIRERDAGRRMALCSG